MHICMYLFGFNVNIRLIVVIFIIHFNPNHCKWSGSVIACRAYNHIIFICFQITSSATVLWILMLGNACGKK